ncbi:response regulator [Marinospirillum alkaliphilum]|uniref:Sensory/regulatory protein RpfC n=1 Tax=Marinospirillum alkaliphilum DSM 21637 TaxID=1122209 RepID=A0A1K1X0B5_9GAMM|nr:response regulator [Marinospirillum alkaliphilum]SFX43129.1 PAS domain S-box-containing protein/diguanylate cyclase (GGDEF) domain-containing protein [Marinospirillum alkaliphilum DSM 21637]
MSAVIDRLTQGFCATLIASLLLAWVPAPANASSPNLDSFFQNHSLPMLWIDPANGRITEANPAAVQFYGHPANVLQGMNIADINTLSAEQLAEERRLAADEGRNYFIFRHRLANGDIRTVEVYSHPYEHQGRTLLLSVIHDITPGRNLEHGLWHYQQRLEALVETRTEQAQRLSRRIILLLSASLAAMGSILLALIWLMKKRRKAELEATRFKAISEHALYGNAIADLDGKVIYVNPFFARAHGYTPTELTGQHLSIFHAPEQMDAVHALLNTLQQQGQFSPTEVWHCDRTGQAFPMLMSGMLMHNEKGEPAYLATAALDLTEFYRERESHQASLVQAKEAAEAANQAKSEFLANMSHEIRTPLNAVIGLSELQLEESLPLHIQQRNEQIHRSGTLLLGIVNDLLDFSKIEAGKMETEAVPFQLDEVVKHLATLFALPSSQKGLELALHLQQDIPEWYRGDMLRLTQVLTNLMANAIKFTEQGAVTLDIRLLEQQGLVARLCFSIRDTGIGMTPAQQQRLFQAFSQADTSITRRHGGTGLGLIISQRLVQLMGSEGIRLDSESGVGSCFEFELLLPLASVSAAEADAVRQPPLTCQGRSCRALIVDDQPIARQILREILEGWHYRVEEAEDGQQAVELFRQQMQQGEVYDVVLMDWEMPRLNGLSALRSIRKMMQEAELIHQLPAMLMVSAHEQSEIQLYTEEAIEYLPKPVHRSSLYNALSHLHEEQTRSADRLECFCGQRVLVVEDHPINQQVVQSQLEQMGLHVTLADDGAQGVEKVRAEAFDLVLMDIQMPVMDGYEATRAMRQFNSDIPIIALTAAALVEDRHKALAAGMNDHLGKPFTGQQLFDHLKVWLKTQPAASATAHSDPTPAARDEPQVHEHQPANSVAAPSIQKRTLLIVDDQSANIKVLANLLKADYTILVANSGARALDIARGKNQPDLILLDILMPDMDGYSVCRKLKNNPGTSRIPVIFITALDDASDETKGLDLGAVDYISKPFHPDIVKSRIRNHMSLKVKTDLLEDMSHLDGLTQIANRRHLDQALQREMKRLKRNGKPLGLVMLDIDYFKAFNDHYGHGKGDECLIRVAAALQQVIQRPGDLLARYGGEEFAVLLPETDAEGVARVAEALSAAVEAMNYPHAHSEVADHVTISVGAVSLPMAEETADSLLNQADTALYQAKHSGRNQVVLLEPLFL